MPYKNIFSPTNDVACYSQINKGTIFSFCLYKNIMSKIQKQHNIENL